MIMTVSQITTNELLIYLREDIADASAAELVNVMRSAAVSFIKSYTGQDDEYIEQHDEFAPVLMALVADMYDTRSYHVDSDRLNPFVQSVLDMHRVNLI